MECAMFLTIEQRIQRLKMRMYKNRQKFDELAKLGETAKCRARIRWDRQFQKQLRSLEDERQNPH
jgi:hypothetical protein